MTTIEKADEIMKELGELAGKRQRIRSAVATMERNYLLAMVAELSSLHIPQWKRKNIYRREDQQNRKAAAMVPDLNEALNEAGIESLPGEMNDELKEARKLFRERMDTIFGLELDQ